jgi:hypothetical protein
VGWRCGSWRWALGRYCASTRCKSSQTLRQLVAPPQTNIKSASYTIGGVDTAHADTGVITRSLVTRGHFISNSGDSQALLAASYASRHKLRVASTLNLNGTHFKVVGLVRPPLGGQTADVYLALAELQKLARQKSLVNVLLIRAKDSASLGAVQKAIEQRFPNAQVASAQQVADSISGSLVDASNLSHRLCRARSARGGRGLLVRRALDVVVGRQARP